jgi:biotin carboxyl carrier protein
VETPVTMKYQVRLGDQCFDVAIDGVAPHYVLHIDGKRLDVDAERMGDESLLSVLLDSDSYLAHVERVDSRHAQLEVSIGGKYALVEVLDPLSVLAEQLQAESGHDSYLLEAPMPGLVVNVHVAPGDRVQVGTPLVVIEAMKMQNELTSQVAGAVREVYVSAHEAVETGARLVAIEADEVTT